MNLLDRFLLRATVTGVETLTPRMRRIRIAGASLRGLAWLPGQHVRVRVDTVSLRTYSVWDYTDGEHLDLCVLDHAGQGPGARWSRRVRAGDSVALTRPQGRLVPREPAAYHLFVGDETAYAAFGAMLRALPLDARAHGVIDAGVPHDSASMPRLGDLRRFDRGGRDHVVDALRALHLPTEPGVAYVAGEARDCQAVRRHLTAERGWPRTAVIVKPFWAPGRRGLD